jgi:hypothetical protein
MALARVVTFEGISSERMAEMAANVGSGQRPEGLPATEMMLLHDPESESALAIVFFDNEEDYQKGHEILDAMPASGVPGRRSSVTKHDVAVRVSDLSSRG